MAKLERASVVDVAARAEVSPATAARALGGYGYVHPETRKRILAAAKSLHYKPNTMARGMKTGRSGTIGIVIADIEDPFFARIVRGATDAARAEGLEVVLFNTDEDPDTERSAIETLVTKQVDGLIVAPALSDDVTHLSPDGRAGRPLVIIDRRFDDLDGDVVIVDNRGAAADAVRRLLALGHERIGMITGAASPADRAGQANHPMSSGAERVNGYLDALRGAGASEPLRYLRAGARGSDAVVEVTRDLLERDDRPTAIFTSNSRVALGALKAIRELGLDVPEDLSFVSFDDDYWMQLFTPPLSVVEQPVQALGTVAASLLIERIHGDTTPYQVRMLTTTFRQRHSMQAPRIP